MNWFWPWPPAALILWFNCCHSVARSVTDAMASLGMKRHAHAYNTSTSSFLYSHTSCSLWEVYHNTLVSACARLLVHCPELRESVVWGSICIVWVHPYNGKMSATWRCPLLGESVKRGSTVAIFTLWFLFVHSNVIPYNVNYASKWLHPPISTSVWFCKKYLKLFVHVFFQLAWIKIFTRCCSCICSWCVMLS